MTRTKRRWSFPAIIAASLIAIALALHHPGTWSQQSSSYQSAQLVETGNIKNSTPPTDANHIKFGIHILDIDNLDIRGMTFMATGWYWLKWDQAIQDTLERDNLSIEQVVRPLNLIEPWFSKFEIAEGGPRKISPDEYYLATRFSGSFFFNDLDQSKAPFIKLWAPINFEIEPNQYAIGQADQIYLIPDTTKEETTLGSFGDINGFITRSTLLDTYIHEYPSSFGLEEGRHSFAGIQLDAMYSVSFWTAFVEFLLPMLLVFLLMMLSPLINPWETDFRLSAPATSILSFIFLQSFTNDRFPATPSLSFMDQLYAYCYLSAVAVFMLFIWSANKVTGLDQSHHPDLTAKIRRTEHIVQVSCIVGFLGVAIGEWLI
jgi:hypothetical protein